MKLLILMLLIPLFSFAETVKVKVINSDGETKDYTYYLEEEKKFVDIKQDIQESSCSVYMVGKPDEKQKAVFLMCSKTSDKKSKKITSYFSAQTMTLCGNYPSGFLQIESLSPGSEKEKLVKISVKCE